MKDIQQEITPVESDDLFVVLDHKDAKFDYPIHCHAEYEINLVLLSDGKHIIGTREEPFSEIDMVIIAPFVPHVWKAREEGNRVITVQFSGKMLDFPMLRLRQFRSIETFLKRAVPAAKFHLSEDDPLVSEVLALAQAKDFELVDMSDSAFSHFFKKHTNLSYITYLNGLRISRACRELESTGMSVSEICWDCGFNNKSNFNRLFLQAKGMTPSAYRKYISRILV